jgi:phospholipid/cholesterol/gamma-HCH transport system permease protein
MAASLSRLLIPIGKHTLHVLGFTAFALYELILGRVDLREYLRHVYRFTYGIFPIALIASIGVGGIVALQGLEYVSRYNASEVFGWAAGISSYRDIAPLLLGFVLANALGARNTAELLAWRSQAGEISFKALGIHTFRIIEGPRLYALTTTAILLFPIVVLATLASAILFAGMLGHQNLFVSFNSIYHYVPLSVLGEGFIRLSCFGFLISVFSIYFARTQHFDPLSVGQGVGRAAAISTLLICILNFLLTAAETL